MKKNKYKLTKTDTIIIKMHYGFKPYKEPLSFSEIGRRLRIHRNAARILFHSAIKKLKHPSNKSHSLHKLIPDLNAPPPPASKKFLYHPPKPSETLNLDFLRRLREGLRIGQNELADLLNLRHNTYITAEQGKNHFSLPVFRHICQSFKLDPLTISYFLNLPFPDKNSFLDFNLACKKLNTTPAEALRDFMTIFTASAKNPTACKTTLEQEATDIEDPEAAPGV